MINSNSPIVELKNLGPKSAKQLARISVNTLLDLKAKGAIDCFIELSKLNHYKPSINFLYAMTGAIENKHWTLYKNIRGELELNLGDENQLNKELSQLTRTK